MKRGLGKWVKPGCGLSSASGGFTQAGYIRSGLELDAPQRQAVAGILTCFYSCSLLGEQLRWNWFSPG